MIKLEDLIKTEKGTYLCLYNNKEFKAYTSLRGYLAKKYNITITDYAIKWNLIDKNNYLKCELCDSYCDSIGKHLSINHKNYGGIEQYKKDYGNDIKTISDNYKEFLKDKISGNKNHNHKNNTTLLDRQLKSPFSIEFWKIKFPEKTEDKLQIILKDFRTSAFSEKEYTTQLSYYLNKGFSEEDSIKLLKERQTTFSLNKCIEKYGEKKVI